MTTAELPSAYYISKSAQLPIVIGLSLVVILITANWAFIYRIVSTIVCKVRLQWTIISSRSETEETSQPKLTVSQLYFYPVKSLRPVECSTAVIDERGFVGDRRFMIVTPCPTPLIGYFGPDDATYRFLTQRQCPSLATVVAKLDANALTFSSHLLTEKDTVTIPLVPANNSPKYRAGLWSDVVDVEDMGDAAAAFLQKILDQDDNMPDASKANVRLVRQCKQDGRVPNDKYVPPSARSWIGQPPVVSLTDGFPLLLANEASLQELNRRLEKKGKEPLTMKNFRPNIVVTGAKPFEEDQWKVIRIGSGKGLFHIVKGCPRCKQSCTDQVTGKVSEEPLVTLAEFRTMTSNEENIYFAQNVVMEPSCVGQTVSIGDTIQVLQRGDPVWDE